MKDLSIKPIFNGSYPHLAWTMEEEEAFNQIPALEWPRPSLLTRVKRTSKAVLDEIAAGLENAPYFFPPR